jgi:hypothetical protein
VRAAQDQDRPLTGLGEDLIGFLEPGRGQGAIRRHDMTHLAVGQHQARLELAMHPALAAAQGHDRGVRGQDALVAVWSGDLDLDRAVGAEMDRAGLGAEMQGRPVGEHGGECDADAAHVAVDEGERRKAVAVARHLVRHRFVAQWLKLWRQARCLQAFEIGPAQRVRVDAEPPQRAAEMALTLDHGDAAIEPRGQQPVLRRPYDRAEASGAAADDDR